MNDKDIKKRNVLTSEEDTYYLDEEEFEEEAPSAQTDSEYDEHDESGYDDIEILREEDLEDDVPTEKNRRQKRRKNKEKRSEDPGKRFLLSAAV